MGAGDVRPDGSTRFAVEDHLVAGAVIASLGTLGIDATSPEAAVADAAYRGLEGAVGHLVTASVGGRSVPLGPGRFRVDPISRRDRGDGASPPPAGVSAQSGSNVSAIEFMQ